MLLPVSRTAWHLAAGLAPQQEQQHSDGQHLSQAASVAALSLRADFEAEALKEKEASAWIAHKADDGQVHHQFL